MIDKKNKNKIVEKNKEIKKRYYVIFNILMMTLFFILNVFIWKNYFYISLYLFLIGNLLVSFCITLIFNKLFHKFLYKIDSYKTIKVLSIIFIIGLVLYFLYSYIIYPIILYRSFTSIIYNDLLSLYFLFPIGIILIPFIFIDYYIVKKYFNKFNYIKNDPIIKGKRIKYNYNFNSKIKALFNRIKRHRKKILFFCLGILVVLLIFFIVLIFLSSYNPSGCYREGTYEGTYDLCIKKSYIFTVNYGEGNPPDYTLYVYNQSSKVIYGFYTYPGDLPFFFGEFLDKIDKLQIINDNILLSDKDILLNIDIFKKPINNEDIIGKTYDIDGTIFYFYDNNTIIISGEENNYYIDTYEVYDANDGYYIISTNNGYLLYNTNTQELFRGTICENKIEKDVIRRLINNNYNINYSYTDLEQNILEITNNKYKYKEYSGNIELVSFDDEHILFNITENFYLMCDYNFENIEIYIKEFGNLFKAESKEKSDLSS